MNYGTKLLQRLEKTTQTAEKPLVLIGIFDCISAAIATKNSLVEALFISGLGVTASRLGWPDIGFLTPEIVRDMLIQTRENHPTHHIIVDIDGGLGNQNVMTHVVKMMSTHGASAFTIEDQKDETKRCGHLGGKQVISLQHYQEKLDLALKNCGKACVIARTDAPNFDDALERVNMASTMGAPIVLVDGLDTIVKVKEIKNAANNAYVMINFIQGGKLPPISLSELKDSHVNIVNYSIPLLEPAMTTMANSLTELFDNDGSITDEATIGLKGYNELVHGVWQNFTSP